MTTERERLLDEVVTAYLKAAEAGSAPDRDELVARHPELAADLAAFFAAESQVNRAAAPLRPPAADEPTSGPAAPPPAGTGMRVGYFGDYRLMEELGRGGMGVVYRARQETLNRTVALKMILSGQLATEADVKRFRAEAEAAARLDHPGIVPVYEVGRHDGKHYFSMAFVEGESLAHRLAQGLPAPRQAAELTRQVAEAVAYAHVEGVVHRDLKPANILIDKAGQPRLTDFGLAKWVEGDGGLTATGEILGTPSYMPPEQAGGKRDQVGPLSDVYALGAVLYCLLTGRPPFQADNPLDTLLQVLDRDPVPPRQLNAAVPRDLETVCLKRLEKEPKRRYGSAQELVADLDRFLRGEPILARPVGPVGRGWRWCRRNPAVAGLAASLLVVMGVGTVFSSVMAVRERREANHSAALTVQANQLAAERGALADQAAASERLTRRYLYSAHMNLAHEAWKSGNVLRAVELLDQHRPAGDQDDLRSFEWGYLWHQCHREKRVFTLAPAAGNDQATGFAISPDGRWVAVGTIRTVWTMRGDDLSTFNAIHLWDVAAGELRHTLVGAVERKTDSEVPNLQFQQLAFSPDSSLFATVTFDLPFTKQGGPEARSPRITVYEVVTLRPRAVIPLPRFVLGDRIAISPDNKTVAAGMTERGPNVKLPYTIMTWDLPASARVPAGAGRVLRQREASTTSADSDGFPKFTFSADGKSLLWSKWDEPTVTVTDLAGDGKDRAWPLQERYKLAIQVSADGKYVATLMGTGGVQLLDARTGKPLHRFNVVNSLDPSQPAAFSPDGKLLAVGEGARVFVSDIESRKPVAELKGHEDTVRAVGFGPDGKTVITVARNKRAGQFEARVWDVATRPGPDEYSLAENAPRLLHPVQGTGVVQSPLGAFPSPKADRLAVVWGWPWGDLDTSRAVTLFDLSTGLPGKKLLHLTWTRIDPGNWRVKQFSPARASLSADGKWLALGGVGLSEDAAVMPVHDRQFVQLWKLASGGAEGKATLEHTLFAPQARWPRVPLAVFSPDGTKLAFPPRRVEANAVPPDRLHLYDIAAGTEAVYPADPEAWYPHAAALTHLWPGHMWEGSCNAIAFTSDSKRVFTAHVRNLAPADCRIIAWDVATGQVQSVIEGPARLGYAADPMVLSRDDQTLATSNDDHSIFLWDVSESKLREIDEGLKRRAELVRKTHSPPEPSPGQPKVMLRGHSATVTAMAFHPDGKTLASASMDGTLKVWDTATGELRLNLETPAAYTLQFTPDGSALISVDQAGTVKCWRAATGG